MKRVDVALALAVASVACGSSGTGVAGSPDASSNGASGASSDSGSDGGADAGEASAAHVCLMASGGGSGGSSYSDGGCDWNVTLVNTNGCGWECSCPSGSCRCWTSGAQSTFPYTVPYAGCPGCAEKPADGGDPSAFDNPCGFVFFQ